MKNINPPFQPFTLPIFRLHIWKRCRLRSSFSTYVCANHMCNSSINSFFFRLLSCSRLGSHQGSAKKEVIALTPDVTEAVKNKICCQGYIFREPMCENDFSLGKEKKRNLKLFRKQQQQRNKRVFYVNFISPWYCG